MPSSNYFQTSDGSSTGVWQNGLVYNSDNDGGRITNAGTVSSARFTNIASTTDEPVTIASGVNVKDAGVGTFNKNNTTIMRSTTALAGQATTAISSASNSEGGRDSIHQLDVMRVRLYKTAIRAGNWNEYTGSWSSDPDVVVSGAWDTIAGDDDSANLKGLKTDVAANPTNLQPGLLSFTAGSGNQASTQGYGARYLW
tara:strand:- start:9379 stop:9972 length:594 start_codon:yes stop_codon:yes gene_type:complete